MKLRFGDLLPVLLLATIIAGCSPGRSLSDDETEQTQEPTATAAGKQAKTEPEATQNPSPTSSEIPVKTTDIAPASRSVRLTPTVKPIEKVEIVPESSETPLTGEVPKEVMESILEDVSELTDAGVDSISVIRAESIIWPDGSLGCGKPGEFYTQAPVPGYWIILEIDDVTFDYRVTEQGYFVLCENPQPFIKPGDLGRTPDM